MTAETALASIDAALEGWEHGPDAAPWDADGGPENLDPCVASTRIPGEHRISVAFNPDARAFEAALLAALAEVTRAPHAAAAARNPRRHIRCRRCNPAGNPQPLAVSGHD